MIKNAIEYIVSAVASLKPKRDNPHRDIFGRVIEHGEEFFHPQTFKGIPVFDTESIMRHYKPILDKLQTYTDIGSHRRTPDGQENLFDALYTNIIRRYIEFAHMIPASEDHHHAHTGGLIVHSLEVSIASLRYAKEVEIPRTGFSDIDNELRPIMHYCAWLAGLLHDAGKIMIDVSVDAAEIIHPLTRKPIPIKSAIPSWRPQKESLTEWALRYNVASYSVSFYNDRKHKRHNVDSAQIIKPILHGTHALDFILSSPLNNETYSELCRVLSGYTKSKDYLSNAVRHGDADSTGRNIGIDYDRVRGTRALSTASRIYQAIRNARKDWDWNSPNAEGWIIGGDVYLRWTSAIDSIAKVAKEMQHALPADARNLLTIMESNGLVQMYDKSNRMIKFSPGGFKATDIPEISSGQRNIQWVDLFKMRGREMVFGADPMPDSIAGLIYLSESRTFIIIDRDGIATEFNGDTGQVTKTANTMPTGIPLSQEIAAPASTADLPVKSVVNKTSKPAAKQESPNKPAKQTPAVSQIATSPANEEASSEQPPIKQPKSLQFLPKQGSVSNSQAIDDMFSAAHTPAQKSHAQTAEQPTAAPSDTKQTAPKQKAKNTSPEVKKQNEQSLPLVSQSPSETSVTPEPQLNDLPEIASNNEHTNTEDDSFFERRVTALSQVATKPKKCSPILSSLLDSKVRYHKVGAKILIDAADAQIKTGLSLKEIVIDLESAGHLSISLMNPNQKLETIKSNHENVKAIPVVAALNQFFSYNLVQGAPNTASNHDAVSKNDAQQAGTPSKQDKLKASVNQDAKVEAAVTLDAQSGETNSDKPKKGKAQSSTTNSKKDSITQDNIPSGITAERKLIDSAAAPTNLTHKPIKAAMTSKAIIAKLSHSDARSFVLGGHPHLPLDWACTLFSCTEEEFCQLLLATKMLQIDVTVPGGFVIATTTFEGAQSRTVILKKHFAKYFSKNDAHSTDEEQVDLAQAQESTPLLSEYSLDFILASAKEDSLIKFLSHFTDDISSFFTADSDCVKVNTGAIRKIMTSRKSEFPFGMSGLNRVIRNNAIREEQHGAVVYHCVPNEKLISILLSDV